MRLKIAAAGVAGSPSLGVYGTRVRAQDGGKNASDGGDALTGGDFMTNWNGRITAFILNSNGYPAGSTALDTKH